MDFEVKTSPHQGWDVLPTITFSEKYYKRIDRQQDDGQVSENGEL